MGESIDHLLLHCFTARLPWHLLFSLFRVAWVIPSLVRVLLLSWQDSFAGKKRRKEWSVTYFCIFWTIWREQNQRALEDKEQNDQWLKLSFLCNLSSWFSMYIREDSMPLFYFEEWVESCWGLRCFLCYFQRACFMCSLYTSYVCWCTWPFFFFFNF